MQALRAVIGLVLTAHASAGPDNGDAGTRLVDVDVAIVGAGFAGISAAHFLQQNNISFHVLEANAFVGGRTRNFDLATGATDTVTDDVIELGGTFVSPSHTALINITRAAGLELYNVTRTGAATYRRAPLRRKKLGEPADLWPWWWWGIDSETKMTRESTFHSFKGSFTFLNASDVKKNLDSAMYDELEVANDKLTAAADSINCTNPESSGWTDLDAVSFEAWIRDNIEHEEGRVTLRAMCRGMIAQEPSQVSLLYTIRSLKGCWSAGDDDQYRIRGGSQGPVIKLSERLGKSLSLSSPVSSVHAKGSRWTVATKGDAGLKVTADHVIVTGPPATVLGIDIPSLGWADAQLLQRMPMGTSLKYFLVYDKPWWRTEHNWSAQIISTKMPMGLNASQANDGFTSCWEHSAYSGIYGKGKGVLLCWIEGKCNMNFLSTLSEEERKNHVVAFFAASLKDDRIWKPERVVEHNWASQPYARGAYTMFFPPGVQSEPAFWNAYSKAEKSEGLWFAGSDYQLGFGNGYIEGAIRSAQSVTEAIAKRLKNKETSKQNSAII